MSEQSAHQQPSNEPEQQTYHNTSKGENYENDRQKRSGRVQRRN